MKIAVKPIMWSAASLLLLYSFAIPGLNLLALLLMFVPNTVLYTMVDKKWFVGSMFIVWLLGCLLLDPLFVVIIGSMMLIPSIILGEFYVRGLASSKIIPYLTAVVMLLMMLGLLLAESIQDVSLLTDFQQTIVSQYSTLYSQGLLPAAWNEEMLNNMADFLVDMIPLAFTVMSFVMVVISHYAARRIVAASGIMVKPFPEAKDWRLPRQLLFAYLLVYILELTIDITNDSFLSIAIINTAPALGLVFSIQAVGLAFFIAHHKGWPKVIPFLLAVPILLIPPFSIVGILDVAFPFRQRFIKK